MFLTAEEERALLKRAQAGDLTARNELLTRNRGFLHSRAIKHAHYQNGCAVGVDDLVQEGCVGFMRAIEKFDLNREGRFLTYAKFWIDAYIQRAKQGKPLEDLLLDEPATNSSGASTQTTTRIEQVEDEDSVPADRQYDDNQKSILVRAALARIRKRLGAIGWDIVQTRLMADDPDRLEDIGARHGVSRERIRQQEKQVRGLLHRYLGACVGEPA